MIQQEFDFGLPNTVKIPDGVRFIRKDRYFDTSEYHYLVKEENTEKTERRTIFSVRYSFSTGQTFTETYKEINQKFLCVNGPLVGMLSTEEKAKVWKYVRYNCAAGKLRLKNCPRNVLVCLDNI